MEFHYAFLIQDIIGILLSALGLKFAIIYLLKMTKNPVSKKNILCFSGNIMWVLSGLNLIVSDWALKTWVISILLFLSAWIFGKMVYKYG